MRTWRVAIIGCGNIGRVHAQVLQDLPSCQIAACVDIRPERAWEMARKYGCPAYVEMDRMLREAKPEAVHLCTPHALHTPQAEMAAEFTSTRPAKMPVSAWVPVTVPAA